MKVSQFLFHLEAFEIVKAKGLLFPGSGRCMIIFTVVFWSRFAEVRIPGSTSNWADQIRPISYKL